MLIPYLRSLFRHPTCIHGILSGGAVSQGEFHSRGSKLHECLRLTWWVPLSTRGRVYDSSSFAFGSEWCEMLILPSDKGELSVHSSWLSVCILWGDAFWVKYSEFVLLSFHTGCVEPLPLSGGVGVFALFCLCMTVLSPASFLRGHVLVDRLRWAVTLVLGGRSYGFALVRLKWSFLAFVWLLVI